MANHSDLGSENKSTYKKARIISNIQIYMAVVGTNFKTSENNVINDT